MNAMTMVSTGQPMTRADLDAIPDDSYRRELIDGVLIVTPAPSPRHQRVVARLFRQLDDACPDHLEALFAPLDVVLADDTVMEPDLLVARRSDFTDRDLPVAPLLAVEVLSPSTRRFDLTVKRSRFEAAGVPSYWVVDPLAPSLVAWNLVDGSYVEIGRVHGDEAWTSELPYPVTVVPAALAV